MNKDEQSVREFIELLARVTHNSTASRNHEHATWCCHTEWLLDQGRLFVPVKRPRGVRLGTKRMCYRNALMRAEAHGLGYAEGYALGIACIPVHHAWCVDADGNAIEVTWPEPGSAYFGVQFNIEDVELTTTKQGYWGIVENDYIFGFPLLHGRPPGTRQSPSRGPRPRPFDTIHSDGERGSHDQEISL